MRYAITKEVDGIKIVTGMGTRRIDRVATISKIKNVLLGKREELAKNLAELTAKFEATKAKDPSALRKGIAALKNEYITWERLQIKKHAVYFGGIAGSEDLYDNELLDKIEKALASKMSDQVVTIDGDIIPSKKGQKFWTKQDGKYMEHVVDTIGAEPPEGAVVAGDDNPTAFEEIRAQAQAEAIGSMSTDEKRAAFKQEKDSALTRAALMRSKLEIEGKSDALSTAKAAYNEEVAALQSKYGI